jgi:hypothetical protein
VSGGRSSDAFKIHLVTKNHSLSSNVAAAEFRGFSVLMSWLKYGRSSVAF